MKRDLCTRKETYIHQQRQMNRKRDQCRSKETFIQKKRPVYMKRAVPSCEHIREPDKDFKRDLYTSKETYTHLQKRPTNIQRDQCTWKEPYLLASKSESPTNMSKETCMRAKNHIKETILLASISEVRAIDRDSKDVKRVRKNIFVQRNI